jgi:O-antigen/teichoic acid export membrane protein
MEPDQLPNLFPDSSRDIANTIFVRLGIYIIQRVVSFIKVVVFAHIFYPSSIGYFALLQSWMMILTSIGSIGFRESIIRHQEKDTNFINTVFSINLIVNISIWVVIAISTIILSKYIQDSRTIFYWLLLSVITISPICMMPVYCWERDLSLKQVAIPGLISETITLLVTLLSNYYTNDQVTSLFLGYSFGLFISWIWIWIASPYRFSFHVELSSVKRILNFGLPVAVDSINSRLTLSGDSMLIGNYWGPLQLGYYTNSLAPFQFITSSLGILDSVTLPLFAKYNNNQEVIRKLFSNLNLIWAIVGFGLGGGIFIFADQIVALAFGKGWEATIPIMKVLAISFAFRYVSGYAYSNLAIVRGRTSYLLKWGIVTSIFLFTVGNFIIRDFGAIGAAWYWLIQLVIFVPLVRFPLIHQEIGDLKHLRLMVVPIFSGMISCLIAYYLTTIFPANLLCLIIEGIIYGSIYSVLMALFSKQTTEAISFLKRSIKQNLASRNS